MKMPGAGPSQKTGTSAGELHTLELDQLPGPKMSPFWAVFLLCSLLSPSQGFRIVPLAPQVDVDDIKDSLAKRDLQKLKGGLLGGNLLGGLLGKDGPLGKVLGKDGAVGGLLGGNGLLGGVLGQDGLLGEGGLLGGVLGKDGLLGEGGLLGGVLGQDGLLGEGGLLGGVLGQDGLLGEGGLLGGVLGQDGLLGGNGLLGGVLGQDGLLGEGGLLGGVLGQDGVLGGLLDNDGVLGGLLGKDGVVDGLLGKDGLVDGLLDAVLDILIGKGGLLGKNGLVGNLLGRNGDLGGNGDLAGLRILNNTLPRISLRSLPGFGHQVDFNTRLLIDSSSIQGLPRCMQVEADVSALVQDKWAAPQGTQECQTVDINISVSPKVPLLDQALKRFLGDVLREMGCNIINTRLSVVSSLLGSRAPVLPLGALGDLPNFSILGADTIQLDLNLPVGDTEDAVGAPTTQGPPLTASLLLATRRPPQLSLSQRALGVLLELAQEQGAFNRTITSSMVPNSISLSTSALFPLIPQLAKVLPGSLPMELLVRVPNEPVVAVRDGKATATLKASIDVLSPALQSTQKLLFSLDADIVLSITPSVSDGKFQTSLALDSINLTRTPLRLDPLSVTPLAEWLKSVLTAAYLPAVTDALSVSVPLPKVPNISLRNAKVDITDADSSPDQTRLDDFCPNGPLSLLPF